MALAAFREQQWRDRYAKHIAPINNLVDELAREPGRGWLPYVAPIYGGVTARLLSVLRDPGPATRSEEGSGFLSMENDDSTAETIEKLFREAGIAATEIVPWNAYPWYINRSPNADELRAGLEPLRRLIDLLPKLRVVMLHGGSAQTAWKLFARAYPTMVSERELPVISTYHTSRQAFWHAEVSIREARKAHLQNAFVQAAEILNG